MALLSSEIKIFKTTNGLGGAITNTEVVSGSLQNVFDNVTKDESNDGSVEYRCIYVKNTNPSTTFRGVQAYLKTQTASDTTSLAFALGSAAVGGTEQTITNDTTAPIGVTFTDEVGSVNSKLIGDIPGNSYKAIWLRRTVQANTSASSNDNATITFDGSTINE